MNRFPFIGRLAVIVSGLAGAMLAWCAGAAPAAFAAVVAPLGGDPRGHGRLSRLRPEPPSWRRHPPLPMGHVAGPVYQVPAPIPAHAVTTGGMPGWQIALIAAAAAMLAAALAVTVDRRRAARRRVTASAA
jgi:hypothetical protein